MRSFLVHTAAFVVLVAACGGSEGTEATTSTTTTIATTTSTLATTTTTIATTTTSPPTTSPSEAPTSLPATWVGVTDDYEAVEVDTQTGEILRSIAQISTAEDVENAECAACINAIDAVWRTPDSQFFFVSECCEPAAGLIRVLEDDDLPYLPGDESPTWFFWSATPSPTSDRVALLGYQLAISRPGLDPQSAQTSDDYTVAWTVEDSFPISNAVWDDETVLWLVADGLETELFSYRLSDGTISTVEVPGIAGWNSARLARRAPGELVVARSPFDGPATEALVIDHAGTVIDRFDLRPGSDLGGYDASGTFLIFTDRDGVVWWEGDGETGTLGEGFVQASW